VKFVLQSTFSWVWVIHYNESCIFAGTPTESTDITVVGDENSFGRFIGGQETLDRLIENDRLHFYGPAEKVSLVQETMKSIVMRIRNYMSANKLTN